MAGHVTTLIRILVAAGFAAGCVPAQWLHYPTAGLPRTPDGKPDLSAPTPRDADGKPDLAGIWAVPAGTYFMDLAADLKDGVPYQPWAKALAEQRQSVLHKDDPLALCLPPGVPRVDTHPSHPFKILPMSRELVILYETSTNEVFREVFTDGRPLPKDPQPSWKGYSVGHWEGDTMVVDTIGFNDRGWIDTEKGRPQTDALHVTERFRRRDVGHMDIGITIDDPKAYTKPWSAMLKVNLIPDSELMEAVCENQRGIEHMVGK
jgi:hypothetical protein